MILPMNLPKNLTMTLPMTVATIQATVASAHLILTIQQVPITQTYRTLPILS